MGSKGRALVAELFRFHLVGVGTLGIGTLVFVGLMLLGLGYTPALAGDYAAGILFSYFMNKTFTFRARVSSDLQPLAYTVLGYIVTFGLNLLLLRFAVEELAWPVLYAQLGIMLVLAALNYLIFKFVVFGRRIGVGTNPE
jgi:putative flippase GtrA